MESAMQRQDSFPGFFHEVPHIRLYDPLAEFLGASADGILEYTYVDVVRLAGHSCPTVAAAYWLTCMALRALYGDALPERGAIRVEFRDGQLTGVTGVIANVVALLTGATHDSGFKGIAGRFDRRQLLFFGADIPLEIRFTRLDTAVHIDVEARLHQVIADPHMSTLLQHCLSDSASTEERQSFRQLWQERVRRILIDHRDDPEVFTLRRSTQ